VTRVVISGVGLVTALGTGTDASWDGLVSGRGGIGPIQDYEPASLRSQVAGEVHDLEPEQFAKRKTLRSMTRNDILALAGATLALRDAGVEAVEDGERVGLFVGSSKEISNPMHILEASLVARNDDGSVDVRRLGEQASSAFYPLFYVEGLQAASLFYISAAHGLKGANAYFAGTADAGAVAIGRAYRAVRRGEVDQAVAGGYDDASSWWNNTKFEALGMLSPGACRPFDAGRDGTVLGEGAAFVVLESLESAQARGATPLAEVTGFGSAFDTHALISPHPQGRAVRLAVEAALRESGSAPAEIDFVAAHGSATVAGDVSEARGLQQVFANGDGPAVTSVKGATGHLMGAAGALNAAVAALAVARGAIPPTLGCETPDPAVEFDLVTGAARTGPVGQALALARGFEGQNVALVVRAVG
jgi:3-oxoacyl-[acyl-carrier-protein] synthase II